MIIRLENIGYNLSLNYERHSAGVSIYTFLIYEYIRDMGDYYFLFQYQLVVLPTQTIRVFESRNRLDEVVLNEIELDEWDTFVPNFEVGTEENIKEVFMKFINTEINLIGDDNDFV